MRDGAGVKWLYQWTSATQSWEKIGEITGQDNSGASLGKKYFEPEPSPNPNPDPNPDPDPYPNPNPDPNPDPNPNPYPGKKYFEGKEWDYVFDIDMHGTMMRLPEP